MHSSLAPNSDSPMQLVDKIGNLIIYLVDKIHEKYRRKVYLTKLLKLLYIIDETAVKETGAPVTGLDYRVWRIGPVAYDVYADLMHNNSEQLSSFVEAKKRGGENAEKGWALIESTNTFNDSELSGYEMRLIDSVIEEHGYKQKDELIRLLHEEGSLWKRVVDEKALERNFRSDSTSPYKIDFTQLISNDPYKLQVFKTAKDSLKI
jgi:uncharacterized phage-associated protein